LLKKHDLLKVGISQGKSAERGLKEGMDGGDLRLTMRNLEMPANTVVSKADYRARQQAYGGGLQRARGGWRIAVAGADGVGGRATGDEEVAGGHTR
jgi:hypothetical protein